MVNKTRKLCASCLKFDFNKTLRSSNKRKPKWLNKIDYVKELGGSYLKVINPNAKASCGCGESFAV